MQVLKLCDHNSFLLSYKTKKSNFKPCNLSQFRTLRIASMKLFNCLTRSFLDLLHFLMYIAYNYFSFSIHKTKIEYMDKRNHDFESKRHMIPKWRHNKNFVASHPIASLDSGFHPSKVKTSFSNYFYNCNFHYFFLLYFLVSLSCSMGFYKTLLHYYHKVSSLCWTWM